MTNNTADRIARQIAALEAAKAAYSNPIMPDQVRRPAPKARRTSVRHRSIR